MVTVVLKSTEDVWRNTLKANIFLSYKLCHQKMREHTTGPVGPDIISLVNHFGEKKSVVS